MTITPTPRVTVLMTTHNGAAFIGESIASILAQRFADFELVVVDDASTDATSALLAAVRDHRLRVIRNPVNQGIVGARNTGFAAASAPYIAALDHDDLSHPDRLARQVAYLDAHPGIVLVGTEVGLLRNGRVRPTDHLRGTTPLDLRWLLHVDNPLTWSSVMIRADAIHRLGQFLRPDYEYADDYDLYHRLLGVGGIARLDAVLTTYRWHSANTTYSARGALSDNAIRVRANAIRPWLGADADGAARLIDRHLSDRQPPRDAATLHRLGDNLEALLAGFCANHAPHPEDAVRIARHAGHAWWRTVRSAVRSGRPWLLACQRRDVARRYHPDPMDVLTSLSVGAVRSLARMIARASPH